MIYIFHGDDQLKSREALNTHPDQNSSREILRLDSKSSTLETINNFLNSQTLFASPKTLVISNYFSIPKPIADKISPLLNSEPDISILLWQDKKLTPTQLKLFPKAKIEVYNPSSNIFSIINAIQPDNTAYFIKAFRKGLQTEAFELVFYLIKNSLRKQLSGYSKFNQAMLKRTYLNLIELEFQTKTGTLTTPKEVALERILIGLMK